MTYPRTMDTAVCEGMRENVLLGIFHLKRKFMCICKRTPMRVSGEEHGDQAGGISLFRGKTFGDKYVT